MQRLPRLLSKSSKALALTAASAAAVLAGTASADLDPNLPTYEKTDGVSGELRSVGSDTLNNLMASWSEKFRELYPQVKTEVEGKGSSTAPPALISGASQLAPMSRAMKAGEVDEFKSTFGYTPTAIRTAVDAIGIFVHKDNPIESLSLEDLQNIYSVNGPEDITWGDVGVTDGDWADMPISLYGRNSVSGTYGYFKSAALAKADYKPTVKEQPGSSGVVAGVGGDKAGIGYSGIGYKTADTKLVPLVGADGEVYAANAENAYAGNYPLSRFLYVYINVAPNEAPEKIVGEFIKMVMSKQGQEAVEADGYFPVTNFIVEEDLK
ncbi:MAG: phosphate ABC transporter substrate-binding protein, partial [Planctomycetota bacterium]